MNSNSSSSGRELLDRLLEENSSLRSALASTEPGKELLRQREEFSLLLAVSKLIVSELDLNKVFPLVAEQAKDLVQADMLLVPMLNDRRDRYIYRAAAGAEAQSVLTVSFPVTVGMCGWVLQNERSLLFGEASPCWLDEATTWERGQQSAVLVPLFGRKQIIGGLSALGKKGGGSFTKHDLDLLTMFANQVSTAIENATLFQQVQSEVAERKLVEEALRASERRLHLATSAGNIGIWDWDVVKNELVWDDSMYALYGVSKEDFGGAYEAWSRTLHPEDQRFAEGEIQAALRGEREYAPEFRIIRPGGSVRIIKADSKTLRDSRGQPLRMIGTNIDITERQEVAAELAAGKEQLAVTLRSIGDGVVAVDIKKNIVVINKAAEEMTGWSHREAMGRPFQEVVQIINEQTRQLSESPVDKVLTTGQIIDLANHTLLIAKDGKERSIADSAAPIRDAKSRIIGVVMVFRDVTEREKTEKELVRIQKIESVGVLAGGIAHDFNNILAAILGNLSLSLADADLAAATRTFLLEAEKATLRARDLTQQLLTFSKGGAPVKELSSLAEVIEDSANFVLRGKQAACQFSFPDDLWLVDIDKGQISQVIQNLVLNACQAFVGSGTISIACVNVDAISELNHGGKSGKKYVKITISDDGIGIPASVIGKVFDPYFSTKKEGNGLGLAISHGIISKHGGQIFVTSTPGLGTTFTLYLPASAKGGEISAPEKETAASPAGGKMKILIMDDDEMVRNVAKAMLTMLGHEVFLAADGQEAIETYKKSEKTIDLLVMDLTIPGGMGGKEAVQGILAINPAAKVVVSSGYSNDPIMACFGEYGFCAALVKPYQLKEFSRLINQLTSG
ncbi:MAG: PAS domain-containing protein [Desulfobulbaceae bacterium]|nr:PAS domain-containing protein [Desulfobulbaceae bacterium]